MNIRMCVVRRCDDALAQCQQHLACAMCRLLLLFELGDRLGMQWRWWKVFADSFWGSRTNRGGYGCVLSARLWGDARDEETISASEVCGAQTHACTSAAAAR